MPVISKPPFILRQTLPLTIIPSFVSPSSPSRHQLHSPPRSQHNRKPHNPKRSKTSNRRPLSSYTPPSHRPVTRAVARRAVARTTRLAPATARFVVRVAVIIVVIVSVVAIITRFVRSLRGGEGASGSNSSRRCWLLRLAGAVAGAFGDAADAAVELSGDVITGVGALAHRFEFLRDGCRRGGRGERDVGVGVGRVGEGMRGEE